MMKYTKVFAPVLVVLFSLTLLKGVGYAEKSVTQKKKPAVKTAQETQMKLVINGKEIPVDSSEGLDVHVKRSQGKAVVNGKTIAIDTSKGVNLRITSKTSLDLKGAGPRQPVLPSSTADAPPRTKEQQQLRSFFGPDWKRHVVGKSEKRQLAIQEPVVKEKYKHKEKPKKGKFKHKEKYKEKYKAPSKSSAPPRTKEQQQLRSFFGPDWRAHVNPLKTSGTQPR